MLTLDRCRIAVVGLGYVGLPLAVELAKHFDVVGFDIDRQRIAELADGLDRTGEVTAEELRGSRRLYIEGDPAALRGCNVYIVTVPTPVDEHKRPDFSPLIAASRDIGAVLRPGDVVVYESTVYPGATEEICIPELERSSRLRYNVDFFVGYSPERINPGDRSRRLPDIPKVVSGSTPETAELLERLYAKVVRAGVHRAPSIRVAEAAKVVENTQRDVNIALINEFAMIFHRLGIDTHEVLEAAGTKWNFLPFRPGLVGGHCIGVDPYYLIQKAQSVGYYPDILLASRRINDAMGEVVATEVVEAMIGKGQAVRGARVLVLGLAFKEDCPDLRNTRVVELVNSFRRRGAEVSICDPLVDRAEALREYGIELLAWDALRGPFDAIVLAVAHSGFREIGVEAVRRMLAANGVLYDIKAVFPKDAVDARL